MKKPTLLHKIEACGIITAAVCCGASANAAVLLSTDFADCTVSGTTASNIAWVTNGVANPGDMALVNTTQTQGDGSLWDTSDAARHLAPTTDVGNGGVALQVRRRK